MTKRIGLLLMLVRRFMRQNAIELGVCAFIVLFHNWNYNQVYGTIADDLPKHLEVVNHLFNEGEIIPYRRYFYPPVSHVLEGLWLTVTQGRVEFTVSMFHQWIYNLWFLLYGLGAFIMALIAKRLTKDRVIVAGVCLLFAFWPDGILLYRWFGFAQYLGIFWILWLMLVVVAILDQGRVTLAHFALLILLQLTLFLTHQYSSIVWVLIATLFALVFYFISRRAKELEFPKRFLGLVFFTVILAGAISVAVFNYRFLLRPNEDGRNIVDILKMQVEGKDHRYKPYELSLKNILNRLRGIFKNNSILVLSFAQIGYFLGRIGKYPKMLFLTIAFVLPFGISLLVLSGQPLNFYTRMIYYWYPPAILLAAAFIDLVKNQFGRKAAYALLFILLMFSISQTALVKF